MHLPEQSDPTWPESWRFSYEFDRHELGAPNARLLGYQYSCWARREATLAMVESALPPPARVLDVAAAQGNLTLALAERGYQVTWNDLRGELAGYVRLKYERGDVEYRPGNALELPAAAPWDIVVATEVIEHVAHPDQFLAQLARLVRPGGYLVLTTPNGGYFRNKLPRFDECPDPSVFETMQFRPDADGHIFLLHPDEIRTLAARVGLEIVKLSLFINPLTNGHVKLRHALPWIPAGVVRHVEKWTVSLPEPVRARMMTTTAVLFRRA